MKKMISMTLLVSLLMSLVGGANFADAAKAKIAINKTKIVLKVKERETLKIKKSYQKKLKKKITWKSSNKKVASVTKKGKVTGKKQGTAIITVKGVLKSGKKVSATCGVTVKKKSQSNSGKAKPTNRPTPTSSASSTQKPSDKPTPTAPTPSSKPSMVSSKGIEGKWKMSVNSSEETKNQWYELYQNINRNQIISTYSQLQTLIAELNQAFAYKNAELVEFIALLQSYDEEYFMEKALCLGSVDLTYGYQVSYVGMEKEELSDHTYRLNMKVKKKWGLEEGQIVSDVMIFHALIVETAQEDTADCNNLVCTLSE